MVSSVEHLSQGGSEDVHDSRTFNFVSCAVDDRHQDREYPKAGGCQDSQGGKMTMATTEKSVLRDVIISRDNHYKVITKCHLINI